MLAESGTSPPDGLPAEHRHAWAVIRQSGFFDAQRYFAQLQHRPADPIAHYLEIGRAHV